jgi:hypothetical protein
MPAKTCRLSYFASLSLGCLIIAISFPATSHSSTVFPVATFTVGPAYNTFTAINHYYLDDFAKPLYFDAPLHYGIAGALSYYLPVLSRLHPAIITKFDNAMLFHSKDNGAIIRDIPRENDTIISSKTYRLISNNFNIGITNSFLITNAPRCNFFIDPGFSIVHNLTTLGQKPKATGGDITHRFLGIGFSLTSRVMYATSAHISLVADLELSKTFTGEYGSAWWVTPHTITASSEIIAARIGVAIR